MKKYIFIIASLLISLSCLMAQDSVLVDQNNIEQSVVPEQKMNSDVAIEAYDATNYPKAVELLEEEIKQKKEEGLESATLYYNLGNAYFRLNDLGKARLNYERAALLDPSDKDIQHNIDYVVTRIEDKIVVKDSLFITDWFRSVQNLLSSNTWAASGVVFFLIFVACLVAFFLTQQVLIKKISFYIGIITLIFVIFANVFASNQKQKLIDRDTAVITTASVGVLASPNINSKELFRLHTGTKVKVRKDDRSWLEIDIADGSVGWIQREMLEII